MLEGNQIEETSPPSALKAGMTVMQQQYCNTKTILESRKNFGPKYFESKNSLFRSNFWVEKNVEKILVPKIIWVQKNLR